MTTHGKRKGRYLLSCRNIFLLLVQCFCGWSLVFAQQPSPTPVQKSGGTQSEKQSGPEKRTGSINGRVVDDEGKPLADARVFIRVLSDIKKSKGGTTDDAGKFRVTNLPWGVYRIYADAPSFVASPEDKPRPGELQKYYRSGETVNIRLIKGGVITGMVAGQNGEPLVGMTVQAVRVRQPDDRDDDLRRNSFGRGRQTDDRGVYRIYGLESGKYMVFAGGKTEYYSSRQTPYDKDAPTYYPSSTPDTASIVTVQTGDEVSGVDIRYRGEPGFTISGSVSGLAAKNVELALTEPSSTTPVATAAVTEQEGRRTFSFTAVPNGNYKIIARGFDESFKPASNGTSSVSLRDVDVTGLEIKLTPLASVSGRIVLREEPNAKCETKRDNGLDEVVSILQTLKKEQNDPFNLVLAQNETNANSQGEFKLNGFAGGSYRLRTILPTDDWYIQSITKQGPKPSSNAIPKNGPAAAAPAGPTELISLGKGENLTGLNINLSSGAGAVNGQLASSVEGANVPATLRLYLVPTEKERSDDTLRYAETSVQRDGSFTFRNLAPGRYLLVSRIVSEESLTAIRPLAWDVKERVKLRREADAANIAIELKPCQHIKDYRLVFGQDGSVKPK